MLNKEPTYTIGVIIPKDKIKKVNFSFLKPKQYILKHSKSKNDYPPSNLTLTINDGDVEIKKINDSDNLNFDGITIHNVPAGRNFHWEKKIDITVPGDIQITSSNNYILVKNIVQLEDYIACVSIAEMSYLCPIEFLKAQTIAARSWILAGTEKKHLDLGIDVCNDDCCQRYQGINKKNNNSYNAIKETLGIVLTHKNKICDARYSKSCGGITENCENVWEMEPKPYLKSIFDGNFKYKKTNLINWFLNPVNAYCSDKFNSYDLTSKYLGNVDIKVQYFRWKVKFTMDEFCNLLSLKLKLNISKVENFQVLNRGISGRIIRLNILYKTENNTTKMIQLNNEYNIRKTLHPTFLYSSAFFPNFSKSKVELFGAGWGHGVGMCQIGALGMALSGYNAKEILYHYFLNTTLKKIY